MRRILLSVFLVAMLFAGLKAETRYAGGDISLLPEYEKAGAQYKDTEGKPIADLIPWLKEQGMNAMRVRLFVDPAAYTGSDKDPNACQDLEYIKPVCKRIVDAGMDLMLDFHYSDTWADPGKQWTPEEWKDLTDEQLYQQIYEYTKGVLAELKANGIVPAFIQPGNEISYGMLWGPVGTPENDLKKTYIGSDKNWDRFCTLLRQAIKACREECPDAKIVIHTERVAQVNVQSNFYAMMKKFGVEYDIVGLSYYPYFHGNMATLRNALAAVEKDCPDKDIMIVETGYSYKWPVPGTTHDNSTTWPYSEEGQNKFMHDLVAECEARPSVNGIFWWWMEYNAYDTTLTGWYNAALFDSTTGKATKALTTLASFAKDSGMLTICPEGGAEVKIWYNLQGIPSDQPGEHGIFIRNGKKILR